MISVNSSGFVRLFAEKLCFSEDADNNLRLCRRLPGEETAAQPQTFSWQVRRSKASPQIERQSRQWFSFGTTLRLAMTLGTRGTLGTVGTRGTVGTVQIALDISDKAESYKDGGFTEKYN